MSSLEEITLLDFPTICRICLCKANVKPVNKAFTNIFKQVLGSEFFSKEYLPRNVCHNCIGKLEEIYNFIEVQKQNDLRLKIIYKNVFTINVTPPIEIFSIGQIENKQKFVEVNEKREYNNINVDLNSQKNEDINNNNNIEIICNTCSQAFLKVKDLVNHERFNPKCSEGNNINNTFNFNKTKRFSTKLTPKPKKVKKNLNQDLNTSLTDCEVCKRKFLSEEEVLNHQRFNPVCRKEHANEEIRKVQRNIQLNQLIIENAVQNPFSSSLRLKDLASIKNPYQCIQCEKCFKNRWCYERHIKTHTGERPHTCNICKRGFRQKAHLKDHLRIHTGEKPYQCFICKKSFRHLSTISKHQHRHIEVS